MTVSGKRDYPGAIIPALLDVLPVREGCPCYLIFCVDNQPNFSVTGLPTEPLGQRKQLLRVLSLDLARQGQSVELGGRARMLPVSPEPPQQQYRPGAPSSAMSARPRHLERPQPPCQMLSRSVRTTRTYPAAHVHLPARVRQGMVAKV
jgi:hypothetical protein